MRKVRVRLSAYVRHYHEIIAVADEGINDDDVIRAVDDTVDSGDFEADEEYWERGDSSIYGEDNPDYAPTLRITREDGEVVAKEMRGPDPTRSEE